MKRHLFTLFLLPTLAACGGGGDDDTEAPSRMPVNCHAHAEVCR